MTHSKRHLWQTRWTLDKASLTAKHECGLVVNFVAPEYTPTAINEPEIVLALTPKHGGHNVPRMIKRMLNEAHRLFETPEDADVVPYKRS